MGVANCTVGACEVRWCEVRVVCESGGMRECKGSGDAREVCSNFVNVTSNFYYKKAPVSVVNHPPARGTRPQTKRSAASSRLYTVKWHRPDLRVHTATEVMRGEGRVC